MKLAELLSGVEVHKVLGQLPPDLDVAEVRDDSRKVQPGDLFVALRGQTVDGHYFLPDAAARGAAVAVVERPAHDKKLPQIQVASSAAALARMAANRFGRPADGLLLVGVTGTNGKSTTCFLVEAMLRRAGREPGLIGTVLYRWRDRSIQAPFTSPPPLLLHRTLREMRDAGVDAVVMEASSHALALERLAGLRFRAAAFTNLTRDHLDFHGDMEAYFAAKARLFHEHLLPAEEGGTAVVCLDGDAGLRMAGVAQDAGARLLTVSLRAEADVRLTEATASLQGLQARLSTPVGEVVLRSPLIGRHNLENLAVAAGLGVALGLPAGVIGEGLSALGGVPGRLERVPGGPGAPLVLVDYAHTPDALGRALEAVRAPAAHGVGRPGRVLLVFGCGGDRDRDKRPLMGRVAAEGADLTVLTTDNPRSEAPEAIAEQVIAGMVEGPSPPPRLLREDLAGARRGYHVELDRREAIHAAVLAARAEDVVLVAGKGHEDCQIIGTVRHAFDDRQVAAEALARCVGPVRPSSGGMFLPSIDLPVERVLQATSGQLSRGAPRRFSRVVIDSRDASPGALFCALRGPRHDGHDFAAQAVAAGATGLLVERGRTATLEGLPAHVAVIEVGDTMIALGQLARAHREAPEVARALKVVGITGSAGKTSTKDLLGAILEAHAPGEVIWTEGNLNNHLGVPLTLLRLRPGIRHAVVEMGMSARGEIAYLTTLARPDVGVITLVGPVHLQSLGSVAAVARAKGELFAELGDGCAVVFPVGPGHELLVAEAVRSGVASGRLRALPVWTAEGPPPPGTAVAAELISQGPEGIRVRLAFWPAEEGAAQTVEAALHLVGAHQAHNAALAAAAALALDVPPETIVQGLTRAGRGKHRGQILEIAGRHLVDDCYNASPPSVRAALGVLLSLRKGGRALAVLGDMLELGEEAPALHREVGRMVAGQLDLLIAVGPLMAEAAAAAASLGMEAVPVGSAEEAAELLARRSRPGDWILVKGSRGMRLERVLELLPGLLRPAEA